MANLPITSRVLKSSKGGMKITNPLLNVGTVTKQVEEDVNLSGSGGTATISEKINKEAANVSGGNLKNFKVERDYSGEGPKTKKEKDAYAAHKEREKTDPCYQYKAGRLTCPEGTELNAAGATPGDRDTCCAKKTEQKKTCPDGSPPDADGNCITKTQEIEFTPETQTNKGMSNFQARQQGRKGIQNERKLKRFKIKDSKNEAKRLGLKGKEKRDFLKKAKIEAKKAQSEANIRNFRNMSDNISTQTEQGSFGTEDYTADKFLTKNQKLYTPQLSVGPDGKVKMETDAEILNRVQSGGGNGDKPKTDYSKVFSEMSENLANKDFSLNNSDKPKPTTFFGPGDDKPTFKDVISGIGDNLVGDKSIFAKKKDGTAVGNALRAINPFKKKGPKTETTSDVLSASDFDMEGSMLMKRKPLKKNFFNK